MTIVADHYQHVIGVDTHAATHTMNVVTAATGAPGRRRRSPSVRQDSTVLGTGSRGPC